MRETLSDIYYRIHFFYETVSGGASIAGKIAVQVDAKRDARSFWWGVEKPGLVIQLAYTMV